MTRNELLQRLQAINVRGLQRGLRPEVVRQINPVPDLRAVTCGFSDQALIAFETNSGISLQALTETIGIPERTLARHKAASRLAPEESERHPRELGLSGVTRPLCHAEFALARTMVLRSSCQLSGPFLFPKISSQS